MIQALFQLEFKHNYFSDGTLKNCKVVPNSQTQGIINRFSLMSTMNKSVFTFYSTSHVNTVEFLEYLDNLFDNEPFGFTLIFNADDFSLTTDLPLDWVGQIELSSKNIIDSGASDDPLEIDPVLSSRSIFIDNAIGTILIYPADLIAAGGENVRYVVSFEARKTQWLYYLINRSQTTLHDPIVSNEDGINFEKPETITMPSGETALSFSSGDTQFMMKENPKEIFNLIDRVTPSMSFSNELIENVVIQGLPTPKNHQFNVSTENTGNPIYSTVYVYL